MTETVTILGAKGRFGRAATHAFAKAGWHTKTVARSWTTQQQANYAENCEYPTRVKCITADACAPEALRHAVRGSDVIVNAVNPPYHKWADNVPTLTANVVRAASMTGATVMIPGNVYNYGANMPLTLREDTSHAPTGSLGRLREEMEQAYCKAGIAPAGVSQSMTSIPFQTIILRAGDFLERAKTGNWFDSHIANKVDKGVVTYPGPLDRMHAWAYLPDMARAMVLLADKRRDLPAFTDFGFEGYNLTGRDLIAAMEHAAIKTLHVKAMPWRMIRLLAHFMPTLRGVVEMSYLWRTSHQIDGAKLANTLPDFKPTPLANAMAEMLKS